jgi:phosphate transport system substrate-binding protein
VRFDKLRFAWRCILVFAVVLALCEESSADHLTLGGTGTALGTMRLLVEQFGATTPEVSFTILDSLGSTGGISALLAGALDIAVSSRPITDGERQRGLVEIEYARTPLVFAVSANSTVTALSSGELEQIYLGQTASWPDGSAVRLVLRPEGDSDTLIVRNISPAMQHALDVAQARPGVRLAVTDQEAADNLERIPGAIGPISLAVIASEKRALRALTLDGKDPTPMNAASGAYPHFKSLFLVTRAKRSPAVERFVVFVRSPAARETLSSNGQWLP